MREPITIDMLRRFHADKSSLESLHSDVTSGEIVEYAIALHEEIEKLRDWQTKAVEDFRELHEELNDSSERIEKMHDAFAKYRGEHRPFIDEDLLRGLRGDK